MPTPTYVPLATITLTATDSEIIFSSIPATFRDLILISSVTQTVNTNHNMQVNSDTGSNYSFVQMFGNGSSSLSNSGTNTYFSPFFNGNPSLTLPAVAVIQFMDYSATNKHKTILMRGNIHGDFSPNVAALAVRWANTAAINTIRIFPVSGAIQVGSSFSLYGIA